ncbi:alpha/beta hydrolase [Streptomyces sp. ET3-23]|uniref:alpha/beta hydrolase n=1 Tax=Streptomyces sp. ET3-23 TaxID=2885643 RepID=UPI001D0F859A|nr:alpha/beta hydrolase [Streptomyces sp. ET3-23]MCC2273957.1 alpha/beta hydrolase [Streptomyces sp. ET3-23]
MRTRLARRIALAGAAFTLALTTAPPAAARAGTVADHRTGTLADGANWTADIPPHWNGTLLLYSHGYGPLRAQDAPDPATGAALLAEGYALAGSSYDPHGSRWALGSAERDQFATLDAFTAAVGRPRRTVSVGQSMGGLVNARIAGDPHGRIAGALGLCGLVAGGTDLDNYQLAAETALAALLAPADRIPLTGYPSAAAATAAANSLTAAAGTAQRTPQGRARIALAAAYLNLPAWSPGQNPPDTDDPAGQEAQQYQWLAAGQLRFIMTARYDVEQASGGDSGSTEGLNWSALLARSPHFREVLALYRTAGLDLDADLAALSRAPAHRVEPAAARWMRRTSTADGRLDVPLLDLHTTADPLAPAEQETAFAARVRATGNGPLLRQAFVARQGHCAFTTNEILAGLHALVRRIDSGHWPATGAAALAADQPAGTTAFTDRRPGRLVTP